MSRFFNQGALVLRNALEKLSIDVLVWFSSRVVYSAHEVVKERQQSAFVSFQLCLACFWIWSIVCVFEGRLIWVIIRLNLFRSLSIAFLRLDF